MNALVILWLHIVPLALSGVLLNVFRSLPWQSRLWIAGINFVVSSALLTLVIILSQASAVRDLEVWNGQITEKARVHDSYVHTYTCNCRSVTTGSGDNRSTTTVCDTCYEDHYTVAWTCRASTGDAFEISKEDSTRKSVYNLPDPPRWVTIKPGEPVAVVHSYTNYVQAVPESLFKTAAFDPKKFAGLVPAYPIEQRDFYRVSPRFISPGWAVPDAAQWDTDIGMMLRVLGPKKQVNVIVVLVKTDDPTYEYALRDAWGGANKNDVVLIIGSKSGTTIDFVRVLTWSKSEQFKVELRDEVQALGRVDRVQTMAILEKQITNNFVRRRMREFAYLESEIAPPTWVLSLAMALVFLTSFVVFRLASNTNAHIRVRYERRF